MSELTPGELAEEHWKWLETLLHKIYVDAFIHGYKHGKDKASKSLKKSELG